MAYSNYSYAPQCPEWWRAPTPTEIYKKLQCPECSSPPEHHLRCSGCHSFVACDKCDPGARLDHGLMPCTRPNCPHLYCKACVESAFITQQRQRVGHLFSELAKSGMDVKDFPAYDRAETMKYVQYRPEGYCVPCYLACSRCEKCSMYSVPVIDVEFNEGDLPVCEHCKQAWCSKCGLFTERLPSQSGRLSGCMNCVAICPASKYSLKRKRLPIPREM